MAGIVVKPRARIFHGHDWVYSSEVLKTFGNPAAGEVIEANADLQNSPEKLNTDPHGSAWLIKVRLASAADLSGLMDAATYEAYIADKGKEASA